MQGRGGAVAVFGAQATFWLSSFKDCTSVGSGGALFVSGFPQTDIIKGSVMTKTVTAVMSVSQCSFVNNTARYSIGGALAVDMGSTAKIEHAIFDVNSATKGGAVALDAQSALQLSNSIFHDNTASEGGAVLVVESRAVIRGSRFHNNSATGPVGGAALRVRVSSMELIYNTFTENVARAGGGGALLWDGNTVPIVRMACDPGLYAQGSGSPAVCMPCAPGFYKDSIEVSKCTACGPGTYSAASGATTARTCALCPAGTFQNTTGADSRAACLPCAANADSPPGASDCFCNTGYFGDGVMNCTMCIPNPPFSDCAGHSLSQGVVPASLRAVPPLLQAVPTPNDLAAHTHWLCGRGLRNAPPDGNDASYGPCVATLFHALNLTGLPSRAAPGFAGAAMELAVRKHDFYGQLISTDSSSLLQVFSALHGDRTNDDSISFLGLSFAGLQGGVGRFSIAIKPTFSSVSVLMGHTMLLRQPFLYITGTDSATGAAMQSDVYGVHLSSQNQTACPVGWRMVVDDAINQAGHRPGACTPCEPGTYIVKALTGVCLTCPPTATCINGAPPIFRARKATGAVDLVLPEDANSDHAIQQAVAAALGVEAWQIAVGSAALGGQRRTIKLGQPAGYMSAPEHSGVQTRRRSVRRIAFVLFADAAQMAVLQSQLASMGIELGEAAAEGPQTPEGEVWEEVNGQYLLRQCPPGNRLINTTNGELDVDAQQCVPCLINTYIIDPLGDCIKCPRGASCPDGLMFVPNAVGSVWDKVRLPKGEASELIKRIVECPPVC